MKFLNFNLANQNSIAFNINHDLEPEWTNICNFEDLIPNTGICAYYQNQQVAIFLEQQSRRLFAVSNYDPFSYANVISRGIIGSIGKQIVVASPIYKQHFCLNSGICVEDKTKQLTTFPVRECNGVVQLK